MASHVRMVNANSADPDQRLQQDSPDLCLNGLSNYVTAVVL